MYFPIFNNLTSPFPILGLSDDIYSFLFKFKKKLLISILGQVWYLIVSIPDLCTLTYFCKQTVDNLIRRRILRRLIWFLHCLLMSHKKDARLIWVNLALCQISIFQLVSVAELAGFSITWPETPQAK